MENRHGVVDVIMRVNGVETATYVGARSWDRAQEMVTWFLEEADRERVRASFVRFEWSPYGWDPTVATATRTSAPVWRD